MPSMFVKQFMKFLKMNGLSLKVFAEAAQKYLRRKGKNKITAATVYSWLEDSEKVVEIDEEVFQFLLSLEEESDGSDLKMPSPDLTESLTTDIMEYLTERGLMKKDSEGRYMRTDAGDSVAKSPSGKARNET